MLVGTNRRVSKIPADTIKLQPKDERDGEFSTQKGMLDGVFNVQYFG